MNIRKIFSAFDISASGMRAQRQRMDAVSSNLANMETTRTDNGEPYRRQVVVMKADQSSTTFQQLLRREDARIQVTDPRHINTVESVQSSSGGNPAVTTEMTTVQNNAFRMIYDPDHPDADENGYVRMPNINIMIEMVDMIAASRSYEANATALEANKSMAKKALEI